jgi:putative cell wall-binding protein
MTEWSAIPLRARRAALGPAGLVMLLGLSILAGPPSATADPLPLGQRVAIGAWAPPAPWAGTAAVTDLERALDHRVDIVHFFETWETAWDRFDRRALSAVAADGRRVLLSWEPWVPGGSPEQPRYSLLSIVEGRHDANLRAWARGLRDHGQTVHLRPMHEMNGDWYPWSGVRNGNTPDQYVAAWRHIHALFAGEGADNIRWVWSPNAIDVPAGNRMESYFPGSDYVDVVALDGYNWGGDMPSHGGWQSFDAIFASAYERAAALGPHPIWIAEVAADEVGGDKAAWIRAMLGSTGYPRLEAIVWFNEAKERNWPITSSPAATAAFREGLQSSTADPPSAPSTSDAAGPGVIRHGGSNRFETAQRVAAALPHRSGFAVVASGESFPDALAAAPLAGARGAPVLLTTPTRLHPATAEALRTLDVRAVAIIGGEAAIAPGVEREIVELLGPGGTVTRIAGPDRYATAAAINEEAGSALGDVALLVNGDDFPDALAAGALAAGQRLPLLATRAASLPAATEAALGSLGVREVVVVGGERAVGPLVVSRLDEMGLSVTRIAGPDRFSTALAVADHARREHGWQAAQGALLARGDDFPDALSAAALAGGLRAPLLLTSRTRLSDEVRRWLGSAGCLTDGVRVIGGTGALPDSVAAEVRDVLATAGCGSL